MASMESLKRCARARTNCASSRCATKKRQPSLRVVTPSTLAASEFAWRLPARGGIHLLNGLYDAKCDGQPVLAITGHTFHDLIGTHYQQDVDLDKLFIDVAAYNQRVMSPAHVINVVDEAIKTSLTRRTVSHITIPKDIQEWKKSAGERSSANVLQHSGELFAMPYAAPPQRLLQQAADLINKGSKVAMLVGRGCLDAREEVLALAEAAGAPVIKALLGKAVIPDRSPYT